MLQNLWDAVYEVKKMVWPSKQETLRLTLAVFAMIAVLGLVLWSVDAVLGALFKKLVLF